MSIFSRFTPIATALSPNTEYDDIFLVLKLFLPWNWGKWKKGKEIGELENKSREYFNARHAISFSSGRASFFAILKSLPEASSTGEIITQAYTTIVIPNAIKSAGLKPVYVDITEDSYNIDPLKIEEKITPKTKAIIVQHTFGTPADMDKVSEIAKKHNLFLIEDCAHSLGAEFAGKKIGAFGDAAFFSFGRDKIISSTSGGMVITNDDELAEKIREFQNGLSFPPRRWVLQRLAHPLVFWLALPIYYFLNLGKYLIFISQKTGLIVRAYSEKEKKGVTDEDKIRGYRIANAMAIMALNQFKKIDRFNEHRRRIAEIYHKSFHFDNLENQSEIKLPLIAPENRATPLYYTIQTKNRNKILNFAAKNRIILGDWFPGALGPSGVDEEKFGYKKGDCPVAEKVGSQSINLPTNIKISEKDAEKVVKLIKTLL